MLDLYDELRAITRALDTAQIPYALLSEVAVDRAIRKVAQLRALFRRVPHHPTPAESRLLAEFEAFRAGRIAAASPAAVRAGFRAAWAARDDDAILSVAKRLPPGVAERDAVIRTYVHLASLRAGDTAPAP